MKQKNILAKLLLSSIFSLALLLGIYSIFGSSVYAKDVYLSNSGGGENTYTSLKKAIEEVNKAGGGTIILKTDFTLSASEGDNEITTNITIKSEGSGTENRKKITRASDNNGYFIKKISENKTLTLENIEINGGGYSAYNGLIVVGEGIDAENESSHKPAKLIINEGTKITNANFCVWGAIDLLKGSSLEMKGGEISNIKVANGSPAIYTRGNNDIKLSGNAKITDNQIIKKEDLSNPKDWWQNSDSFQGGAIFLNDGGTLTISDNVEISNNKTLKDGGAIRTNHATINMTGGTINNNTAEAQGGGLALYNNTTITINGGKVLNNISKGNGGAISLTESSNLTIANSDSIEISKNASGQNGGAIFCWDASLTINGGKFENNGKNITEDINDENIKTAEAKTLKGGAIFVGNIKDDANKNFIINGGTISNNKSSNSGGGIYLENAKLTINTGTISENSTNKEGGGIYIGSSNLTIKGGTISENSVNDSGAGISTSVSTVTIEGGIIEKNTTSTGQGGGVNLWDTTMTMTNGKILKNTSKTNGGGIALNGSSSLTVGDSEELEISKNTCDGNGGGIYCWDSQTTINGGKIENNGKDITKDTGDEDIKTANAKSANGGGIYIGSSTNGDDKKLTVKKGTISNNKSKNSGAGITLEHAKLTMEGGTISENATDNTGAGISASVTNIDILGGTISGNVSETSGGGVYLWSTTMTINGGKILRNISKTNGGGISVNGSKDVTSNLIVGQSEETEISKNTCTGNGGGIFVWDSEITVNGGKIENNGKEITNDTSDEDIKTVAAKSYNGGGISISNNTESAKNVTITGGTISNNSSTNAGGGIFSVGVKFIIKGGTISENTSSSGGGIYVGDALSEENKTVKSEINLGSEDSNENIVSISNNIATNYGGGITISDTSVLNMYNGKIEGNVAKLNGGGLLFQGSCTANIKKGNIINNRCDIDISSYDFDPEGGTIGEYAGGGMYIGENCTVTMDKLLVKQNSNNPSKAFSKYIEDESHPNREKDKYYSGNGITCCPSSKLYIYKENGCAIYDNINTESDNQSKQFDVFQGKKSEKNTPEFYNTNIALGGGYYGWTDFDGNPIITGTFKGDKLSVLKSNLKEADKQKAEELALVKVENNHATSLWGAGGITCNGILKIGNPAEERQDDGDTSIRVEKQATKNAIVMAESEQVNGIELKKFDYKITLKGEGINTVCKNVYVYDCNNAEGTLKARIINDINWQETTSNVYTTTISLYINENSNSGWYFYLLNIPDGTEYTIEEILNSDNYITNVEDVFKGETIEGRIVEGTVNIEEEKITENDEFMIPTAAKLKYSNDYQSSNLVVNKRVVGENKETETEKFNFTVNLKNEEINGTYGEMEFIEGVAKFSLGDGESKTAEGLPVGIEYEVEEEANSKYVVSYDSNNGTILSDNNAIVNFTNTKKLKGDLRVTKEVIGTQSNMEQEFTFTVTLSDKAISGTYGDMTFENGIATFKLKHGQEKVAKNLPGKITYSISETDNEGYEVTAKGEKGTIEDGEEAQAEFINGIEGYGNLKVTKEVTGTEGDKEQEFTFTVTLSDKTISGKYGDMTFENGIATFTLKHGQEKVASNLPSKITYTVNETNNEGYEVTSKGEEGIIEDATETVAEYINEKEGYGNLKVTKEVTGTGGDKEQEFTFTVILNDNTVNGIYGNMTFKDGVAKFTLKHGQEREATDLPSKITYRVSETGNEGYEVTTKGEKGTIEDGKEAKAAFVNNKDKVRVLPNAGYKKILPYGIVISMILTFIYWRKLQNLKF